MGNGKTMEVTKHASKRIRERLGLPKRAVEKNAVEAFHKGKPHSQCKGRLKKYIDYILLHQGHSIKGKPRIWNNMIYLFTNSETLVTVFHLPPHLRRRS